MFEAIKDKALKNETITLDEAKWLFEVPLDTLLEGANTIRSQIVGNHASLCTIINGKSGKCSEDCKFCAQSGHYETGCSEYDFLSGEEILKAAKAVEAEGVHKFSIVTSGRDLSDEDLEILLPIYKQLVDETKLDICASHGFLTLDQAKALKAVGVKTYHHNVESSSNYYNEVCTTHDYSERIDTINNCKAAGLNVCCGGIWGLGETREMRLQMAYEIKALEIKSVPINFLMPVAGTPMALNELPSVEEILRTLAVYRFIMPDVSIRFAGGRGYLKEAVKSGFMGGVNAALVGNYLTTVGSDIAGDKALLTALGFEY